MGLTVSCGNSFTAAALPRSRSQRKLRIQKLLRTALGLDARLCRCPCSGCGTRPGRLFRDTNCDSYVHPRESERHRHSFQDRRPLCMHLGEQLEDLRPGMRSEHDLMNNGRLTDAQVDLALHSWPRYKALLVCSLVIPIQEGEQFVVRRNGRSTTGRAEQGINRGCRRPNRRR